MPIAFIVFLAAFATAAYAQTPGTRLTVDVNVTSVFLQGDTTSVTYVLYNRPGSQDSLMMFAVDAPAHVSYISRPNPDSLWSADTLLYGAQPAATWGVLGLLAPAATTPSITFKSTGLPGILKTWTQGNWPIPTCCDDDPDPPPSENLLEMHSVTGKTVGIEPWPSNRSSQALLARLRSLTQTSCAPPLNWITDSTLCTQLLTDLDAAETSRAAGANVLAKTSLDHYKASLSGLQPGTFANGVTAQAYWLLRSNADIVKSVL